MQADFREHGVFSWNELITTDLEQAKEFYSKLFGWTCTETKTIYGNTYVMASKGQTMIAGMMLRDGNASDDTPPCWNPYITVDDVDASAKMVEELGGEVILPPTELPNLGRLCVIKDRQGVSANLISYYTRSQNP